MLKVVAVKSGPLLLVNVSVIEYLSRLGNKPNAAELDVGAANLRITELIL